MARADLDYGPFTDVAECVGDRMSRSIIDQKILSELGFASQMVPVSAIGLLITEYRLREMRVAHCEPHTVGDNRNLPAAPRVYVSHQT